jgi:hypothetical protein
MTITVDPLCPDPDNHARLFAQRETTWREASRAVMQLTLAALGYCPWCGGEKPTTNLCCVICGEPSDAQECAACFDEEDRRW